MCSPLGDVGLVHALVYLVRRALSKEQDSYGKLVVQLGLIERLVSVLDIDSTELRMEAVWALLNIASGRSEDVKEMINLDVHRKVMQLLFKAPFELFEDVYYSNTT